MTYVPWFYNHKNLQLEHHLNNINQHPKFDPFLKTQSKKLLYPKRIGLIAGPLSFILLVALFPNPEGLSESGKYVFAISVWMIIWWITEAIPVYATALLPLGLMPMMGILPLQRVSAEYMHPIIVLLLGMFLIAIAIEKTGFHRKIAYEMINVFGYTEKRIIFGFILLPVLRIFVNQ